MKILRVTPVCIYLCYKRSIKIETKDDSEIVQQRRNKNEIIGKTPIEFYQDLRRLSDLSEFFFEVHQRTYFDEGPSKDSKPIHNGLNTKSD